ncbi:MAG TPA: ACP phosphodiesterase [Lacibacter sp.]|nr:ACP phosphodiesterase [Lacibacter sp.]
MNYLAHAYLSFQQPELLVGNMISDFVKGKKKFDYPEGIQKGIALHRSIDTFTDEHPATKAAKEIFRPHYRLYASAFVDVVYDHFLATDVNHFTKEELKEFADNTYSQLEQYFLWMPERFAGMFPYMKQQNWLYNYHTHWGIEKSLGGVVRRAVYLTESDTAYRLFKEQYELLKGYYDVFFPELYAFTKQQLEQL